MRRGRTSCCATGAPARGAAGAAGARARAAVAAQVPARRALRRRAAEDGIRQARPPGAALRRRGGSMKTERLVVVTGGGKGIGRRSSRASPRRATGSSRSDATRGARGDGGEATESATSPTRRGGRALRARRPGRRAGQQRRRRRPARRSRARPWTTGAPSWTSTRPARSCARARCCGGMLERDSGRIVTVASTAGLVGSRYTAAYTASKHAAVGLMRAVAAEVGRHRGDRQRRLPDLRAHGHDRGARSRGSPRHRTAARRKPRRRSSAPRRWGACSSPTRSPSRSRSSPRPRRARSTARRSSSTEEGSRHEPVPGVGPA